MPRINTTKCVELDILLEEGELLEAILGKAEEVCPELKNRRAKTLSIAVKVTKSGTPRSVQIRALADVNPKAADPKPPGAGT